MYPPVRAHWRQVANTVELVLPSATQVHNPNGKLIGSAVFPQLTAENPILYNGRLFPPTLLLLMGDPEPM